MNLFCEYSVVIYLVKEDICRHLHFCKKNIYSANQSKVFASFFNCSFRLNTFVGLMLEMRTYNEISYIKLAIKQIRHIFSVFFITK